MGPGGYLQRPDGSAQLRGHLRPVRRGGKADERSLCQSRNRTEEIKPHPTSRPMPDGMGLQLVKLSKKSDLRAASVDSAGQRLPLEGKLAAEG